LTDFAKAVGGARGGSPERARAAVAELARLHAGVVRTPVPGPYDWAGQIESLRLGAAAWIALAEGRTEDALEGARAAAALEERVGKNPVTPGALLPERELLGDMLIELGRPADALVEYEASLREAPNRLRGLYGAARAAELSGRPARARELYAALVAQCVAGTERPEVAQARRFLEGESAEPAAAGVGR
jgi:predicted Zn-dependent protease